MRMAKSVRRGAALLALLLLASLVSTPARSTLQTPLGRCGDPATFVHAVQGTGANSPLEGADVVVEGAVVGDFQGEARLGGFFLQEEDTDVDDDPLSSEGIFVYNKGNVGVQTGQRVRGRVDEFFGLTELTPAALLGCGQAPEVTPTPVTLPLRATTDLERYEGMLVTFPQALSVTDLSALGKFGTVLLSQGGRLLQPTSVAPPGALARALQQANALSQVLVDDGSLGTFPDPIVFPAPQLTASNTLRNGDTTRDLSGVLGFGFGHYRLYPTVAPAFEHTNPRPLEPLGVGGTLRVAGFNVKNYFNGNGKGKGFPTSRGADSTLEFQRQRAKVVQALLALDADVIGLVELENDGYSPRSAIQDVLNGLNAAAAPRAYAFVKPASKLGHDKITVGLLYRTDTVLPFGPAASTAVAPLGSRRAPLAQTFEQITTGERFTVVVNHFKSKGCRGTTGLDADQSDGQGCYNAERTQAAKQLTQWLAGDPTHGRDPDFLILGDLNAYAQEDPIRAIKEAGYTNLVETFVGGGAYSFNFNGLSGYLDHALASASLSAQVAGATEWHINADEPNVLDYNTEHKSVDQRALLYDSGPFRSSDHDPLLVGLTLNTDEPQSDATSAH